MQKISLDELEDKLSEAERYLSTDYSTAMSMLGAFEANIASPQRIDPFDPAYRAWVLDIYKIVANVAEYDVTLHEADNNVTLNLPFPDYFPFSTKDTEFCGRYIAGVGLILEQLGAAPGSRIVEYGVGWGHVSAALARLGHDVFCVDIEAKFLHLTQRQAEACGCRVSVHHGHFGETPFPLTARRADAVVFYEAFHHSLDHQQVLRSLRTNVLRPGGCLLLAAEPVDVSFPMPWGIRCDGHALWAIRRNKWMELGFNEDYLIAALLREGFVVTKRHILALGSFGLSYRCILHEGLVHLGRTMLPSNEASTWAPLSPDGEDRRFANRFSRATLDYDPKWQSLSVRMTNYLTLPLTFDIDAGSDVLVTYKILGPGEQIWIDLPLPVKKRELRVRSQVAQPKALGINDDVRELGVAVEELRYNAA